MTPFDVAAGAAFNAVFGQMAKDWLVTPRAPAADVNAPAAPDASRVGQTIQGIFFDPQAKPFIPNGFDPRSSQRPGVMTGSPRIEFAPTEVAKIIGLHKDDLLSNAILGTWRVSSTFTKPYGVLVAYVNKAG